MLCPGGGIGRRAGLKIRLGLNPVPVLVWPRAFLKELERVLFFYIISFVTKY